MTILEGQTRIESVSFDIPLAHPVPGFSGAFWASVPLPEAVETGVLTPTERDLFETFDNEKRRREWLGGRIAARAALRAVGAGACSVLRAENGAPQLVGRGADGVEVAITHGRARAAAVATPTDARLPHLGIDWVDREDAARIRRLTERVLSKEEQALCGGRDVRLQLAWGAREAVAKASRTGMFLFALSRVHLTSIDEDRGVAEVDVPGVRLGFRKTAEGALVVIAGMSGSARAAIQAQVVKPPKG